MNSVLTQWHPAFCSAIKLELISDKDNLDIDTFYKGIAYASLYKANSPKVDGIKANDITISFVRETKPIGLFRTLKKEGVNIEKISNGIYYVHSEFPFGIQVIELKELNKKEYVWLTSLTDELTLEDAETVIIEASKFSDKDEVEYLDSVLQVVMSRNVNIFKKIKEVPEMCEALYKLMKPEIDKLLSEKLNEKLSEKEAALALEIAKNRAAENRIKELEAKLALLS